MRRGKRGSGTSDITVIRESEPNLQRQAKAILLVLGYANPEKYSVAHGDADLEQLCRPQLGAESDTRNQRCANNATDNKECRNDNPRD